MSKYIVAIKDKNQENDEIITCETAQEVLFWKHKAEDKGYEITVRREK